MATTKPFLLLPPQPTSPPARPRLLAPRPRRAQASSVACSAADADDRWLEPARGARRGARGAVAPDAAAAGGPWVRRARRVGRRRWPLHGHRRGGVAPRVPAALPLPQVPGRLRVHPGLRDLRGHARAVRIRGVAVGSFVRVDSSLHSIDAYAELHSKVEDEKIIVPRNSLVEMNQSGLVMETMIDITPKDPLPTPSVGPLDPDCSREGLILCDKERIKGQQGVNLDAMVGILTRLGRDMEQIGVDKSFKLAEKVASIMEGAQPLLSQIEALGEEIQPLLSQVCDSDLLKDVEIIAKGLADASGDLRKLQSSMLTTENTDLITQSIFTLVFTLKNIESISSDISGFTGDETTRQNIKLLVRSLSRLL